MGLSDEQLSAIQGAIANLSAMESKVERALADPTILKAAKFNSAISVDVDKLVTILTEIKNARSGARE